MDNKDTYSNTIITYEEVSEEEFKAFLNSYEHKLITSLLSPTDPYQKYFIEDGKGPYIDNIVAKISFYDDIKKPRYWIVIEKIKVN